MRAFIVRIILLSMPFALTACGEGWVPQKTDTYFPYGNERTAGSGVVYVRAKMMPEKELKLEPIAAPEVVVPPQAEPAPPVLDAEVIFEEAQTKGGTPIKRPVAETIEEEAVQEVEEHGALSHDPKDTTSAALDIPELTPEEYIAQAPKEIEIPDVQIIDDQAAQAVVAEDVAMREPQAGDDDVSDYFDVYEGVIVQPVKEIVSPKRGLVGLFKSDGERSLEEIYSNGF